VNDNLALRIDSKRLGQLTYYESVLDSLQAVCEKADVLPCELDAAAFDYEDLGRQRRSSSPFRSCHALSAKTTDAFLCRSGTAQYRCTNRSFS
jgi:hypothetical protein